ncbi:MAG: ABC transporter permease [Syntrophus sp. (in: bacteria)]|nr:ABC transporter permease [Syntrophus sp. (in: bacteria)]
MMKLLSSVQKELTLLRRDFGGLLILFLMPVVLVVVVTLVQENVLKSMGETKTEILFINNDGKDVGALIEKSLQKSGVATIVTEVEGKRIDIDIAKKAVAKGDFQLAIVVPRGLTESFRKKAKQQVKDSLIVGNVKGSTSAKAQHEVPELLVYFDPALRETFRVGVMSSMEKVILGIETEEKIKALSELLPEKMEGATRKAMGPMWSEEFKKSMPSFRFDWDNNPIIIVGERVASQVIAAKTPNTVQQNVPAWTLFGMFFIVAPLGASLIRERQDGMLARLLTMPVSYLTIISGKIAAYVVICMIQFVLIMVVGKVVLPLLGTPVLDLGTSPAALVLIALSAALAASGYGILLGTIARTHEQVSAFGAVSVVIAAALGGIMVPAYVMPKVMQAIGAFSPLGWGLNAFLNIFVRGGGVGSILPEVALMLLFFVSTTLLAWFFMFQRGRIRIH